MGKSPNSGGTVRETLATASFLASVALILGCDVFTNRGPPHYTYGPEPTENQHIFPYLDHDAGRCVPELRGCYEQCVSLRCACGGRVAGLTLEQMHERCDVDAGGADDHVDR